MNVLEIVGFVAALLMMIFINAKQNRERHQKDEEDIAEVVLKPSPPLRNKQKMPHPPAIPERVKAQKAALKDVGELRTKKYEFKTTLEGYLEDSATARKENKHSTLEDRLPKIGSYKVFRSDVPTRGDEILKRNKSLKDAIILQEILNKPKSLRNE